MSSSPFAHTDDGISAVIDRLPQEVQPEHMSSSLFARNDGFFSAVIDRFRPGTTSRVAVLTHLLPDRPAFLRALRQLGPVEWVIPVPYSNWPGVPEQVDELGIDILRPPGGDAWPPPPEWFRSVLAQTLERSSEPLVLFEIGGYFASVIDACADRWRGRLLGAVEDTEAGHRRYRDAKPRSVPVYSVARSPLKGAEDLLVGESIAFSVERILRALDRPLRGTATTVLGYGSVGSATASALASRGARVKVWDPDPSRRIVALAAGFPAPDRQVALERAELVVGTSGTVSFKTCDLALLSTGCVLASGSSRQTEFALETGARRIVVENPTGIPIVEAVPLSAGREAYLAYAGFPVNFADAASLGAFLQLTQAESIAAICSLIDGTAAPGLQEVSDQVRTQIAKLWIDKYLHEKHGRVLHPTLNDAA